MWMKINGDSFTLGVSGRAILAHSAGRPMLRLGRGHERVEMYRGNFEIEDRLEEKIPLREFEAQEKDGGWDILFGSAGAAACYCLRVREEEGRLHLCGTCTDPRLNRLWLRLPAAADEFVYGGGEQFSCLNLRGKRFPVWSREQGVGRNKKTMTTLLADLYDNAGGDYHTTFFPQPTFVSSQKYYCHLENYEYAALDFSNPAYHELEVWSTGVSLYIQEGESYIQVLENLTALLGRQTPLPDWALQGAWLGIQGGTGVCDEKLQKMLAHGAQITAIWAQDWEGTNITSFGKRLYWDWFWDEALYPGLPGQMAQWQGQGVRFMGYINPYVVNTGRLFHEAKEKGYLARTAAGGVYEVDFGEFYCGVVDFTNPAAWDWYKGVIKKDLLGFGLSGWMADFGEYLPTDCVLHSGESAMALHNKWPALWAKMNYEALEESGKLGEVVFYMRAGAAGSQKYSTLMWAGDQNVDFSLDDGLASVITAALSCGMSGCGLHTSDIGGYTTLYEMKRTKELFQRWAEFCAFTPVMRTHEGNRPDDNWQFDSDEETMAHFSWCTQVHRLLFPYLRALVDENCRRGLPVMRPLFLHYPQDSAAHGAMYQYLLGPELLVAPVYEEGKAQRRLYLPGDDWVGLWDGAPYGGGTHTVEAPIGRPPVFYRRDAAFAAAFRAVAQKGPWRP